MLHYFPKNLKFDSGKDASGEDIILVFCPHEHHHESEYTYSLNPIQGLTLYHCISDYFKSNPENEAIILTLHDNASRHHKIILNKSDAEAYALKARNISLLLLAQKPKRQRHLSIV